MVEMGFIYKVAMRLPATRPTIRSRASRNRRNGPDLGMTWGR